MIDAERLERVLGTPETNERNTQLFLEGVSDPAIRERIQEATLLSGTLPLAFDCWNGVMYVLGYTMDFRNRSPEDFDNFCSLLESPHTSGPILPLDVVKFGRRSGNVVVGVHVGLVAEPIRGLVWGKNGGQFPVSLAAIEDVIYAYGVNDIEFYRVSPRL